MQTGLVILTSSLMDRNNIIHFEPRQRFLEKARAYVASPSLFLEDDRRAVSILLKAFQAADGEMKLKMLRLLGSAPDSDVARFLYRIMTDPQEAEEIRHCASIQLNVVTSVLEDPSPLVDRLLEDLAGSEGLLRALAAFAWCWEGNERATLALVERRYDEDLRVQVAAVDALANLADERVFNLLAERLAHAPLEQKRSILYNLWRFGSRKAAVAAIYADCLAQEDHGLKLDALGLLNEVAEPQEHLAAYSRCLADQDPQLREMALARLERVPEELLLPLRSQIEALRTDPDPAVKATAARILDRIPPSP